MAKKVSSLKHTSDTRAHIPSKEEAGYEDANDKVSSGKKVLELPKNPVVHRGQDPELFWLNKYGNDDRDDLLRVDIRSLYRHEHIAPETLIRNLYTVTETERSQMDLFTVNELFGNALEKDELEKVSEYYEHQDGWTNRLIQGDSHLVMASLLEREGMAGQVQMIYIDPPYGINYSSNWQVKISETKLSEGNLDNDLTGEPEVIKAFRDTWEEGIHSYLSYIRDRLLIAKELLSESGSCFIQINDENFHLVRSVMDEVFGSECFVITFPIKKKGSQKSKILNPVNDYIVWYGKSPRNSGLIKYRQLYEKRDIKSEILDNGFSLVEIEGNDYRINSLKTPDGVNFDYLRNPTRLLVDYPDARIFKADQLQSGGVRKNQSLPFIYKGKTFRPKTGNCWKTTVQTDDGSKPGMEKLAESNRFYASDNVLYYRRYLEDFGYKELTNWWDNLGGVSDSIYVVQTNEEIIKRCMLMTTDPGDLVLDPTCGSGTTAFVAEKWGRRWLTIDTSRIALNITKTRLMTAVFPYYRLYDEGKYDIRLGFKYKEVPHKTLGSIANNEPTPIEKLFDKPEEDNSLLRVSGPFTVETLQNFEPVSPEDLDNEQRVDEEEGAFEEVIKQHLLSTGIKNGRKDEHVVFRSVELLAGENLHAEGFFANGAGEKKAYFHIGPKFGTVSKKQVNEAIKECRQRGDANWLVILGFSFESDIEGSTQTTSMGTFEVTKVRIHDDLLQEGLKKKPAKSAASFVTIGEPDIEVTRSGNTVSVEIKGLDIYDPIKDEVKARNVNDIAYWMVDDDYDGSNFVVKQVFFCGGEKDAFAKWHKGLDTLARDTTKRKVEKTLKIEIDDEAFDRLYGHISHPIEVKKKGQKIMVRIVSQFGEESSKVLTV